MNDPVSTIIMLLIPGWFLGLFALATTVGDLIYILLVLAVIGIIYQLSTGSKAVN